MALIIGNLVFETPPVFLAPMAGITDPPFRLICKRFGCDVVSSEMVSAQALIYNSQKTAKMLEISDEERPVSIQLFGGNPESMREAAKITAEKNPDLIDINMGCPVPKVVKNGAGSALLKDLPRAGRIISEVVKAVKIPVTVKIRSGWDEESLVYEKLSKEAENAGAACIIIHARTSRQQFTGRADWSVIKRIKQIVGIPVIGNGDIYTAQDAIRMLSETGCDGIMAGRGVLGNPWLFKEIKAARRGETLRPPSLFEKISLALEHLSMQISYEKDEFTAVKKMRKHFAWYLRGHQGIAEIRRRVNAAKTREEIVEILTGYGSGFVK